uniref:Fibronectin type-III domain-containing protein n=1 Tax=Candidatus Kentrum sp. LFY TaxID=2126342 RepID=A0A450URY6_9GAMM|nr:MAG: hypothetical protein BECKLFY1418B_GA0070995_10683 [Candidatus Kentron sp. LFY]
MGLEWQNVLSRKTGHERPASVPGSIVAGGYPDGGKVSAYRVERRAPGNDAWTRIDTAMETEARVSNQPQGEKFEFCVVAANKAGDGARSNVVTAVL